MINFIERKLEEDYKLKTSSANNAKKSLFAYFAFFALFADDISFGFLSHLRPDLLDLQALTT